MRPGVRVTVSRLVAPWAHYVLDMRRAAGMPGFTEVTLGEVRPHDCLSQDRLSRSTVSHAPHELVAFTSVGDNVKGARELKRLV